MNTATILVITIFVTLSLVLLVAVWEVVSHFRTNRRARYEREKEKARKQRIHDWGLKNVSRPDVMMIEKEVAPTPMMGGRRHPRRKIVVAPTIKPRSIGPVASFRETNPDYPRSRTTSDTVTDVAVGAALGYGLAKLMESSSSEPEPETYRGGGGESDGGGSSGSYESGSSSSDSSSSSSDSGSSSSE